MSTALEHVLAEYHQREAREAELMSAMSLDEVMARRDDFLICVGAEVGGLLNSLVKGLRAVSILELGTSYGYSTLWLADAARATGGRVTSFDVSGEKQASARAMLGKAGLDDIVDFREADAVRALADEAGPFDFVLVDLWKELYVPSLDAFAPKLTANAVVVADNMIHPPAFRSMADAYRARLRELGMESVLLPIGNGIDISRPRPS